jgi:hypothetical protein
VLVALESFREDEADREETISQAPNALLARNACNASLQPSFPFAQDMKVFPDAGHDLLDLDALLSPKAREIRDKTRAFMVCPTHLDPPCWLFVIAVLGSRYVAESAG